MNALPHTIEAILSHADVEGGHCKIHSAAGSACVAAQHTSLLLCLEAGGCAGSLMCLPCPFTTCSSLGEEVCSMLILIQVNE